MRKKRQLANGGVTRAQNPWMHQLEDVNARKLVVGGRWLRGGLWSLEVVEDVDEVKDIVVDIVDTSVVDEGENPGELSAVM